MYLENIGTFHAREICKLSQTRFKVVYPLQKYVEICQISRNETYC